MNALAFATLVQINLPLDPFGVNQLAGNRLRRPESLSLPTCRGASSIVNPEPMDWVAAYCTSEAMSLIPAVSLSREVRGVANYCHLPPEPTAATSSHIFDPAVVANDITGRLPSEYGCTS